MKTVKSLILLTALLLNCLSGQAQFSGDISVDLNAIDNLPTEKTDKIASAFVMMDAVQKAGSYIQTLSDLFSNGELPLPVGIKKDGYELIIQKININEETGKARIFASCAFKFKDTGQRIAFEGKALIESKTGPGTAGKLSLIAPVRRNIGKESALIVHEGTSVSFGCEGIESFDALLSWIVTSDKIVPVDTAGNAVNEPLYVSFEARFHDFDSYLVSLNINRSFAVKGLKDIVFTQKGATIDQSDTETSSMTRFPDNYFPQANPETVNLWRGMAVSEASVTLPPVFKKPGSENDGRITVSLQEALFDENGFTGNVALKDILQSETIDPDKWDISLTGFSLGLFKNTITSFGMEGDVNIPPFGKHSLLPYTASFNPAIEEYEFKVNVDGDYEFPVLKSTLTLNELSTMELLFKGKEVYPSLHASGSLTVKAPLGSDTTKTVSIPGISFENMVISRESPYLEIGAIGITGELHSPKLAGFERLPECRLHQRRWGERPVGMGFRLFFPCILPEPVGGHFSILGGLVKGNCSFDFEVGEKCTLTGGYDVSPFGEDVIGQLTPNAGAKDVNVFAAPQAIFNIPAGKEMTISEDGVKNTYMVTLEEFTVKYKDNGKTIAGRNKTVQFRRYGIDVAFG
jgi:hypothetical protein